MEVTKSYSVQHKTGLSELQSLPLPHNNASNSGKINPQTLKIFRHNCVSHLSTKIRFTYIYYDLLELSGNCNLCLNLFSTSEYVCVLWLFFIF